MKKKELINQNVSNEFSLIDFLDVILNVNKSKYYELGLNLIKNKLDLHSLSKVHNDMSYLVEDYKLDEKKISNLSPFKIFFISRFIDYFISKDELEVLNKYIDLNERNMTTNNDVTSFKSFDDLVLEVSLLEVRNLQKDLSKEIVKIHEDEEWLILKPLTWFSAQKYGSSTKWCTSMSKTPEYFNRYSTEGILIYCLNKITGNHVGIFKSLVEKNELSFWNLLDKRVDSMETGLPAKIIDILRTELDTIKPNSDFLSTEQKQKEQEVIIEWELSKKMVEDTELIQINETLNHRIGRLVPMTDVNVNDDTANLNI